MYINVTSLYDTTIIIVVDRHVFYLNDGTKIVVLYIRTVIVTIVKTKGYVWCIDGYADIWTIIGSIEVELAIGKHRKLNTTFGKDEGIAIIIRCVFER